MANTLISKASEMYIDRQVLSYCFKIMSTCINQSTYRGIVTPLIPGVLTSYCIPLMLMTEKDVEDFEGDPVEFIRKAKDPNPNIYTARNSILEMIRNVIQYKSNPDNGAMPDYLEDFFKYLVENLGEYLKQDDPDIRIKDALLL